MSWTDIVGETRGVLAVFGGEAPPLTGVDVQTMLFTYEGPSVVLSVALPGYPEQPPPKWAAQGFNTVVLTLYCFVVEDVRLDGWRNQVTGDLTFERVGGRVAVRLDGSGVALTLTALSVDVQKVAAYQRRDDDAPR